MDYKHVKPLMLCTALFEGFDVFKRTKCDFSGVHKQFMAGGSL